MNQLIKPKHLQKGDAVGLVSPAAPLAGLVPHRTEKGIKMLENMGFKVKVGKHALKISEYTAGNAGERAEDINNFFQDTEIKAIISFIGGNHSNQVLEYLDFPLIKKNPKIFIGFSDATVLHFAFLTQANLVTFYGPAILTQFAENPEILPYTKEYFNKALMNAEPIGKIVSSQEWTDETLDWFKKEDLARLRKMIVNKGWEWLKKGKVIGPVLGGCLPSMMHLRGTKYWPNFSDAILFWEISESGEDFTKGESVANIDAYLTDLKISDVFDKIKGMIIGRPFGYTADQTESLINIIREQTKDYGFPVLFGADIGHTDPMITLPLGVKAKLDSSGDIFELLETGVS